MSEEPGSGADEKAPSARRSFLVGAGVAAFAPVVINRLCAVRWAFTSAGAAAWVVGVAAKLLVVRRACREDRSLLRLAACRGSLSGLTELGAAAAVLGSVRRPAEAAAVGAGAGSVEVAALVSYGAIREVLRPNLAGRAAWRSGARESAVVRNAFFIERSSALLLHVGTRGLVYLALRRRDPLPALAALTAFAAVDGVAAYGKASGWNWFSPPVARRFYGFAFGVGALTVAMFLRAAR